MIHSLIAVDDFDDALRVNLRGVFLCMKYEIPVDGGRLSAGA